jgi:hypothetical protein
MMGSSIWYKRDDLHHLPRLPGGGGVLPPDPAQNNNTTMHRNTKVSNRKWPWFQAPDPSEKVDQP